MILKSLLIIPCTEEELCKRDFLKNYSLYGIGMALQRLENLGAIYYKGKSDIMYVKKKWIKENRKHLLYD
ncbi:MAG: hypothetical protein RR578_03010 [Bacilli bacterium]